MTESISTTSMGELTLGEFTGALASKSSVPGGGGASALAGSIGIALGDMVGEFTLGKKKYADVEPDILCLMEEAQQLRKDLLECIDEDAKAFEPLSRAYGIPKNDPVRAELMEQCLRDAAAVPMKILRLSARAIELEKEFAEKGSRLMVSDAATGAALCRGALAGAAVNVKVNTKLMTDRVYAETLDAEVDEVLRRYTEMADEVFLSVYQSYGISV